MSINDKLNDLFRSRLSEIQQRDDLTQTALAKRMKIPQPYLSLFQTGVRNASIDVLEKWSKRLGFQLSEIFSEL